jgi:hypothetical protein
VLTSSFGPANGNRAPFSNYLLFPIYIPDFRLAVYSACHLLTCWFLLKLFSSTLKMEAICSSETPVATQHTTRRHIPEDDTLHNHRCENLKSYGVSLVWKDYYLLITLGLYVWNCDSSISKLTYFGLGWGTGVLSPAG